MLLLWLFLLKFFLFEGNGCFGVIFIGIVFVGFFVIVFNNNVVKFVVEYFFNNVLVDFRYLFKLFFFRLFLMVLIVVFNCFLNVFFLVGGCNGVICFFVRFLMICK